MASAMFKSTASSSIMNRSLRSERTRSATFSGRTSPAVKYQTTSASLAGRGVVILPGLGNNTGDYDELKQLLQDRGSSVAVAEVRRIDWLRNAAGFFDINYWRGTLEPKPTVDWYLNRVSAAVEEVKEECEGETVCLLAHSAGGWLARVWMFDQGTQDVDSLVCLGSPLQPPFGTDGVFDQTRGILTYVTDNIPGCFHEDVKYVCVTGKYVEGKRLGDNEASISSRVAGLGYKQVYGSAEVWGDGIVPVPVGQLEGATCIELDGVYHSPLGAAEGREWYGSAEILDQWVNFLEPPRPLAVAKTGGFFANLFSR
mmetsp:Transcript_15555/g.21489  ORF Transcript_15555/g.21489 Transcript_15555/m.21489 type:complete len:313 (-) Transcript_15555:201-1139(-)|eukprot:CAMPEP_0196580720 /NCGR_PEP_ID=MMETSP1081-20130531/30260_1 /TAXON_ID=36882 /ORGANISM="Pyramimonas amylifera, Strain CCMP720" /LENGTH=312 /DNA_ID=CAMNT_0041900677 /DNA_START=106 /DNA_END=1044 /DNA_ORIENTATION=+